MSSERIAEIKTSRHCACEIRRLKNVAMQPIEGTDHKASRPEVPSLTCDTPGRLVISRLP
ncbi:MAG: hypothetical protein JWM11_2633 [Planctomycetaceae bacterium]|nr:hypothetical protein [Planctomycetaceae bacterium]